MFHAIGFYGSFHATYFDFEKRGKVVAKNKGELDMYFISGIKLAYQKGSPSIPSDKIYL